MFIFAKKNGHANNINSAVLNNDQYRVSQKSSTGLNTLEFFI